MNVLELLLLLVFVLFPLLQALLGKLGGGRQAELPPEQEAPDEYSNVPTGEPSAGKKTGEVVPKQEGGWSAEWGHWPSETLEELAAEDVVTEDQAEEIVAIQRRLAEREASEAARVSVPVVSMEALEIDRAAEHRRFHDHIGSPVPVVTRRRRTSGIDRVLRRPSDLQRAIVLAEVLGPPRALQPAESSKTG